MDLGLRGKVVIVTGGASGIGAAVSRVLLAEGARVAVLSRMSVGVDGFVAEMQKHAVDFEFVEMELADACEAAVRSVEAKFGRVDALVNNAGVNDGVGLATGDVKRFEESLRVNLVPAYALAHACLPQLKANVGSIVNVASKVALTGQGNTSGYAAAKGGLLALTREWAVELLPFGIRVNAVVPAEVMTPAYATWLSTMDDAEQQRAAIEAAIPLGHRMTTAEEIAATVVFLLSPTQSSHTTGQQVIVDGGYVHLDRKLSAMRRA